MPPPEAHDKAILSGRTSYVRFGSEADICAAKSDVRFTPKSGHVQCNGQCPLWAISGHRSIANDLRKIATNLRSLEEEDAQKLDEIADDCDACYGFAGSPPALH